MSFPTYGSPGFFENLHQHYRTCRRNKRNTLNALRFEMDAAANLLALAQELRDHTYRPGPSICFVTDGPKPREAFAAEFGECMVSAVAEEIDAIERRMITRFPNLTHVDLEAD